MPKLIPFRAILYNKDKIKNLSRVVAPPYDVIPKDMQDALYRAHPYNIVRLILGKIKKGDDAKDNRYTRAAASFVAWLKNNIFIQDSTSAIYIYSQIYRYDKRDIERVGFIGLMELDDGKKASILPHENTLSAHKADRLNLIREVRANLSPIFVLYEDRRHRIVKRLKGICRVERPIIDVYFDGVRHKVCRLIDSGVIEAIEDYMKDEDIFIADGHHRYEAARIYSKYIMAYFAESDDKTLTILPAHRLVKSIGTLRAEDVIKKLAKFFHIEKISGLNRLMMRLDRFDRSHAFGIYLGQGRFYLLKLKDVRQSDRSIKGKSRDWKRLDVSILHLFILQHILGIRDEDDNVGFVKDAKEAASLIDKGSFEIAFFLNPTRVSQVKRIAKIGERMPRKATYFYPKPLSGLVINKF